MLHCEDRSFYVGHTDDLEKRLAEHEQGLAGAHTATRLPVTLVLVAGIRDESGSA